MDGQAKPQSQLDHEQNIKSQLYGIDISFTLLAVMAVCFRFWARYRSAGSYGWDDWLVLISLLIVFVNFAMNAIMIENGLGLQAVDVPLSSLLMIGKAIYADEIVYVVVLALIKVAILTMYCRVFPLRSFKIAAWILSTITVLWSLMFIFICIFQCSPIPRAWNLTIPGKCLNLRAVFIGNAVPNIVTDAAILVMPMCQVWKLRVRTIQRFALTGIFLLGAFVIVASTYRFTRVLKLDPLNLSYTLKQPTTWSHVEVCVALICACLPVMKPLLMSFLAVIGLNRPNTHARPSAYSERNDASRRPSKPKKKGLTGLTTEFSDLDLGRDGRSTPARSDSGSQDELPLNKISVQRDYEQKVETSPTMDDGMDDRRRNLWYPGN